MADTSVRFFPLKVSNSCSKGFVPLLLMSSLSVIVAFAEESGATVVVVVVVVVVLEEEVELSPTAKVSEAMTFGFTPEQSTS